MTKKPMPEREFNSLMARFRREHAEALERAKRIRIALMLSGHNPELVDAWEEAMERCAALVRAVEDSAKMRYSSAGDFSHLIAGAPIYARIN